MSCILKLRGSVCGRVGHQLAGGIHAQYPRPSGSLDGLDSNGDFHRWCGRIWAPNRGWLAIPVSTIEFLRTGNGGNRGGSKVSSRRDALPIVLFAICCGAMLFIALKRPAPKPPVLVRL